MLEKHLIFLLNVIGSFIKDNKKQQFLPSKLLVNWYLLVQLITLSEIKAKISFSVSEKMKPFVL